MNTQDNSTDGKLTEAETAALIRGRKLGFLLAISALPEDVKEELAFLAQNMTMKEQDRLLDVFEAKYLDEQTKAAEIKLKQEIEPLVKRYQAEDEIRANKLSLAISKI